MNVLQKRFVSLLALGFLSAGLAFADEVVAHASRGGFAVDARTVKETTWDGDAIIGGETTLVLQSSPDAWGAAGGGTRATITWESASGIGTVAAATTAESVWWTPEPRFGTNTLTYVSGSVVKNAKILVSGATATTPVSVPFAWLESHFPGVRDYEALARQMAANGVNRVWEAYAAGLDPTDESDAFRVTIEMRNGVPFVSWTPNCDSGDAARTYRVFGKCDLADSEESWYPAELGHRFFKVEVGLPDGRTASDRPGIFKSDATGTPIGITGDVLVIDVSGGTEAESYPIKKLLGVDLGTFNCDIYKTDKIVLRNVPAGTYYCQPRHNKDADLVATQKLSTKGFYIGVFPITQRQYELVMGTNTSTFVTDAPGNVAAQRPVESVYRSMIRGNTYIGGQVLATSSDSFLRRMVVKTGLSGFDLPTEAQWEIACRAGSAAPYGAYWDGTAAVELTASSLGEVAWYKDNSSSTTHAVGGKRPNLWGLYDMQGNVMEWCRDFYYSYSFEVPDADTPVAQFSGFYGSYSMRGGGWYYSADYSRPSLRYDKIDSVRYNRIDECGFRIMRWQL